MRLTLAAIVMIGLPAVVVAQPPSPAPGAFPALPPIGLPLPPIGLPLPSIGLPPVIGTQPRSSTGQPTRRAENQQPRSGSRRSVRSAPTLVYFIPTYGWGHYQPGQIVIPPATGPTASSIDQKPEPPTGSLRLEVQPAGLLQLYVDGSYAGTPDDFNGELALEAGPHKIEIRAMGYETLAFDVRIAPQRSITYRGALKPADVGPHPNPTVPTEPETPKGTPQSGTTAAPTTIYFIPECYLGNVPPADVTLPANCDLSRLITRKPSRR